MSEEKQEKIIYPPYQVVSLIREKLAESKALDIEKFQLNEVTGKIELLTYDKKIIELTDELNSVIINAALTYSYTHGKQFANEKHVKHAIKEVALDNTYNPIKNYLRNCRKLYESERHPQIKTELQKLLESVIPVSENQELQTDVFLTKWLVGCVARVFKGYQNKMLIIHGKQGIGKSTFFAKLCKNLSAYYSEQEIVFGDKDSQAMLGSTFIWNLDEFGTALKTRDRNKIKGFITLEHFNFRKPYASVTQRIERICSFAGTTNDLDILTDPTGNRRYLIIQVEKFDFEKLNSINADLLWGELTSLAFESELNYQLTPEEAKLQSEQNKESEVTNPLVELFNLWLEPAEGVFIPYIDIETKVSKENSFRASGYLRFEIPEAMLKIGAKKHRTKLAKGYSGFRWRKGHHPAATLDLREIEAQQRVNPQDVTIQ